MIYTLSFLWMLQLNGNIDTCDLARQSRQLEAIKTSETITIDGDLSEPAWTAEISIPFQTLKFSENDFQTWRVNFHRGLPNDARVRGTHIASEKYS